MNLTTYKQKQEAAKKGYDLLKKKADALKVFVLVELDHIFISVLLIIYGVILGSISRYLQEDL
jgi:hypothetical protein